MFIESANFMQSAGANPLYLQNPLETVSSPVLLPDGAVLPRGHSRLLYLKRFGRLDLEIFEFPWRPTLKVGAILCPTGHQSTLGLLMSQSDGTKYSLNCVTDDREHAVFYSYRYLLTGQNDPKAWPAQVDCQDKILAR